MRYFVSLLFRESNLKSKLSQYGLFLFMKMFNPFQRSLKRVKNHIYFQSPTIENIWGNFFYLGCKVERGFWERILSASKFFVEKDRETFQVKQRSRQISDC